MKKLAISLALLGTMTLHAQQRLDGLVNSTADRAVEQPLRGALLAQLQAATDDSTATVKTGWTISGKSGAARIFETFTLSASAPLTKGGSGTTLLGSDGFPNAFVLKGKYTHYSRWAKQRTDAEEKELDALCADVESKTRAQAEADPDTVRLAQAFGKTEDEAKAIGKKLAESQPFTCASDTVTAVAKDRRPEFDRLMGIGVGTHHIWGVSASIGHSQFSYLQEDLTKGSASKVPWGTSVFLAALPRSMSTLFTVGFDYRYKYKDADAKTLCPQGTGTITCKSGPLGAPVKDNAESAYVELRRELRAHAFSLKVGYDFEKEQLSLDVPIYLVPNADASLSGGIRLGWVETQGAQIGVFVTSVFSIFPQ